MDGCMRAGPTLPVCRLRTTPPLRSTLHPRVTAYRARRSALSGGQQAAWERRWHELGTYARDADGPAPLLDTEAWFGRSAPVVLEIGWGTGTSTLAMAQAEPHLDVVAVEVYRRGLAQLLGGIDREGVTNIRLVRGDGVDVLEHMFAPGSLTGVRVFFPDPWPKARHHKRRLIQPATVALIADRLRDGGVLHAATDHPGYAEQIAEVGDAEPRLRRVTRNRSAADLGAPTGHEVRDQGPSCGQRRRRIALGEATMSLTEDIRQADEVRHRAAGASGPDGGHRAGPVGVGRTQPGHGPRFDPRRPADRRASAPVRRVGPVAAGPDRRTVRRTSPTSRLSRRPPSSRTSRRAAPMWSAHGWRHCATSASRSSRNRRSTTTVTSTSTCSTTSPFGAARAWPACWWPRPTGRHSGNRWRRSPATASPSRCSAFANMPAGRLASETLEFVDLEDIPGVFREPLPRIGLDSLPEQGAWLQPFRPLSSLLTSRV